jgi:hypothetical protein
MIRDQINDHYHLGGLSYYFYFLKSQCQWFFDDQRSMIDYAPTPHNGMEGEPNSRSRILADG